MTNATLTTNQTSAMHWLIKSCCGNMGGKNLADLQCDPFTWVEASDLENAGWGRKTLKAHSDRSLLLVWFAMQTTACLPSPTIGTCWPPFTNNSNGGHAPPPNLIKRKYYHGRH